MNVYRYRLHPAAGARFATQLEADSLFGAVAWEVVRRSGEADLTKLLDRFRKGEPPFLLSNAFPGDLLARPLVSGEAGWITRDEFTAIREGRAPASSANAPALREIRELHSGSGEVFETRDWTFANGQNYFSIYARVAPEWVAPLGKLLAGAGERGIGARRGMGRGQFTLEGAPEACPWLDPLPFESGFVTLSNFVPQDTDPTRGRWAIAVKYPKLAGEPGGRSGQDSNPLKGRLLQLRAGSCFQCPGRPRRWYGSMIPVQAALHYGLALAIGIKWPNEPA